MKIGLFITNNPSVNVDIASVNVDRSSVNVDIASVNVDRPSVNVDIASVNVDRPSVDVDIVFVNVDRPPIDVDGTVLSINEVFGNDYFLFACCVSEDTKTVLRKLLKKITNPQTIISS